MTNRSLSTPNSGLRVFSASLLSALLIMMPFVQLAAASRRASGVGSRGPESTTQAADSKPNTASKTAAENVFVDPSLPGPAPAPLVGPVIVATKDDGLATATTVAPGGTINYSVNIKNNGTVSPADDATGVVFTDIIDSHTALVVDSAVAAVSDRYNAIGNVQLSILDGPTDLLANDIDPDTGNNTGMTVTAETKSSTQCAGCNNVTINADGSFTYDPPVGFAGTDTFTYTAHSTAGPGTATETVTISVANEIWFINSDPAACTSNCDGRLSHPFKTLAAFNAVNDGAAGHPGDNDWIFLFESATDYAGPATLRTGQKFIGQDATASLATLTGFPAASGTDQLPVMNSGNGTTVNITGANVNGINLNSGNTLRGFTVGNVGTGTKINGTSFGTLTVGNNISPDVTLNGTGRTLNLVTGTFAATSGFVSVASTSMTGQGMTLTTVGGTVSFGSTTISNASTQCMQVSTSTANINFGNTSCSGGTEGVVLSSNGAGTRTFGTLSITSMTAGGFIYSGSGSGGGDVNITGAATINVAGNAVSVSAPASGDLIDFQAATSATTTGAGVAGVLYSGVLGAELKFNSLSITRNNGTALDASGGGTVTVTNGTGSITSTTAGGPAIVAANIALNANFSSINSTGGNNAVNLTTVSGTSNFGTGQLTGTGGGATFLVSGGTASVTYSGNITQGAAAAMVSITGHTTGTITFQTGTLAATLGTGLQFNGADGIYTFSGPTNLGTGSAGDAGIDILDGSAGTFTFANATINNPSGVAVNIDGTPNANTGGISLAGSISKTTGGRLIDFNNYDTGTANISATLSCTSLCDGIEVTNNGSGPSSGIVNFTAATKTLNTSGDTAVNLDNNDSGEVNFTGGGLDIDTTSGTSFNAINGGTVTVTGTGNSITSTTGTAVNVASTTIGANGLTFQSIAHNASNSGTNPAIALTSTGAGAFTVTGTGTTDGSGGTIENIQGSDAVKLNTTGGLVTLKNMIIEDITASNDSSAALDTRSLIDAIQGQTVNGGLTIDNLTIQRISDDGINGTVDGVTPGNTVFNGLTITNSTFQNTNRFNVANFGDSQAEAAVYIQGIKGTVSVTGTTFQNCAGGLFMTTDSSGTLDMTVRSNAFTTLYKEIGTSSKGNFGISLVQEAGSLSSTVRIGDTTNETNASLGNTFTNAGNLASIRVVTNTGATGAMKVSVAKNTMNFTDHSSPGQPAGNTIYNFPQGGVLYRSLGTGNYEGIFAANVLNEVMHADGGIGQLSLISERGANEFIVRNNTFNKPWDAPIELRGDGANGGQTCAVLFTGNTYVDGIVGDGTTDLGGQSPYNAFYVQARNNGRMDLTMQNEATPLGLTDTSSATGSFSFYAQTTSNGDIFNLFLQNIQGPRGYRLNQTASSGSNTFNLYRNGSASGTAQGVLQDNGNRGGGGVDNTNPPSVNATGTITLSNTAPTLPSISAPLMLAEGGVGDGSTPSPFVSTIDQPQLDTIVEAAKARWSNTGLTQQQLAAISDLKFEITDMTDSYLGEAGSDRILVSRDAAGKGWFIDSTPDDDSEFRNEASGTRRYTDSFGAPAGRVDLLTALEHEIGHRLGLKDSYAAKDRDSIMYGYLTVGERRVPAKGQAANAQVGSLTGTHFLKLKNAEGSKQKAVSRKNHAATTRAAAPAPMLADTVTANIGALPAGSSVTITFQVTVNNPPNLTLLNPPRVENQGTVSGGNFPNVLTDDTDPSFPGAADKTRTLIDLFNTTTTLGSDINPSNDAETVTFTATVAETPSQTPNPTGTVDFIDTSNGDAVICNDVPLLAGVYTCQTATLSAGSTHNIRADYSGDGNFEGSQSNIVAQVVNACASNPVVTKVADTNDGVCDAADCSLREAIATVCSAPNNNITFDTAGVFGSAQTITLTLGELSVSKNVTINAPDAAVNHVTVSGGGVTRVFKINAGKTVTLRDFTITNGLASGVFPANAGGGIYNDHGTLTLLNDTISGNTADFGGGVYNNGATSGSASLTIINTTLSGNNANLDGAAIFTDGNNGNSILIVDNSTISGNNAKRNGGGINDLLVGAGASSVTTTNATFSANHCDFDNDTAGRGGAMQMFGGVYRLRNTIVAGNFQGSGTSTPDDITFSIDAANSFNNVMGNGGSGGVTHGVNGNQIVVNALLGSLANNGGPTETHALLTGSPAIEAGDNTYSAAVGLTTDQRGTAYPRVADSADVDTTATVDVGAFELHPSVQDIANQNTNEDTPIGVLFNLGDDTGALISSVTATSSNATLVPNAPANLAFTGAGGSRTLTITPAANQSGTTTITVTVTATNGRTAADTFDLTVTAANDNPTLTTNAGLTVNEASTGNVIDNTKLKVDDVDNTAAELTFTVGTAPANGTLKNNGAGLASGGTFTQADIDSNLLTYDHNGSETTSDSFTFTVSDGAGGTIGSTTFNITVTAQNDAPTVGTNTGTTVNEGSTANTITNAMLSVTDPDNTAAQITFTVGTAPANGTLKNNGVGLAGGGTFTQADINGNFLTYDHNGTETTSDSFTFTVSDGAGGTIGSTAFNITVTPQNDAPVVTTTVANLAYTEGDPATAVDTGLTVTDSDSANLTGASASITTNFQSGQDVLGWVDNNLADNITLDGSSTAQTIVLTGSDTPANYQAALRAVTYVNSSENPSTLTRTVTFTAGDGTANGQGTRSIDVSAVNDSPTVTTNAGLTVINAGTGTIDNTKLKVDDVDNTAAQLTFTVGTATTNGTLKKGVATLSAGGTFTQADIDGNQITYTHNGTATTTDSFTFTVSDGAGGSIGSTTFNITIGSPNLSINDAKVVEPASPNTIDMTFTVSLAAPAGASGASVNFQTNDGSATAGICGNPGADYVSTNGNVFFGTGEQVKTINVPVCSDAVADDGETFTVTLSGAVDATIVDGTATGTITANTPGTVLISELRTSGPGGAGDDFVELYNNSGSAVDVSGYGLFKMGASCADAPVLIATLPGAPGSSTTVIPARGHYLLVGAAYSLTNYGGTGAAAGNLALSSDIETDRNVGLFTTSDVTLISSVNRLDAVGFGVNVGGACNLLREASTLPPIAGNATLEHSYFRKMCDWIQGSGCTVPGIPKDTNNNANDFWLADTAGSAITGRLGAPGPENLASPIRRDNAGINVVVLDGTVGAAAGPNRERNGSEGAGSTPTQFGTMTLRYRVINNTGAPVTRLRYRVVDISTAIQPAGPTADLRAITGTDHPAGPVNDTVTCTVGGQPAPPPGCTVTVRGTTLETPPNQAIGGGYNSTLSSGTITTGTPLPNGQSLLISLKLGVQKTGTFRFYIIVEALP